MAYSPTTWQTGDTVTAEKLNNMEQGIANAVLMLEYELQDPSDPFGGTIIREATAGAIYEKIQAGAVVALKNNADGYMSYLYGVQFYYNPSGGPTYMLTDGNGSSYEAENATDYLQSGGK